MYACAGQRPAPAGVGLWPGWMGTDHPAAFGGGPERLKTLGVGGGCEQCLLKADIAGSGHGACSNRKAEGQSGTTVFPATWFWVTLLVAMFRRESGICLTLCDPLDCSPPGSSVHRVLQARIRVLPPRALPAPLRLCCKQSGSTAERCTRALQRRTEGFAQ